MDAGVHLDKVEASVFVQKLKRARTTVTDFDTGVDARLGSGFPYIVGNARRRGFFNNFLMAALERAVPVAQMNGVDRKSTRLNSSHVAISYAVFCLKKKKKNKRDVDSNTEPQREDRHGTHRG